MIVVKILLKRALIEIVNPSLHKCEVPQLKTTLQSFSR